MKTFFGSPLCPPQKLSKQKRAIMSYSELKLQMHFVVRPSVKINIAHESVCTILAFNIFKLSFKLSGSRMRPPSGSYSMLQNVLKMTTQMSISLTEKYWYNILYNWSTISQHQKTLLLRNSLVFEVSLYPLCDSQHHYCDL